MVHVSNERLLTAEPYAPGLSRDHVARTHGVPVGQVAKLGSAENPFGPSPKALVAIAGAFDQVDLYPDWTAETLRTKIAATYGVDADQVVCGAGETEIISLAIGAFSAPGETILMYRPCFPIYHLFAENAGRVPDYIDMGPGFAFHVDRYVAALRKGVVRIAFLTNPHSPSGRFMEESDIRRICEAAGDALVVLDEAYIHFTETDGNIRLTKDFPNLIVMRTFSKAFGLAGLRVGFGIGARDRITALRNLKPTWNVGALQVAGAAAALDDEDHVGRTVSMIAEMRSYVGQRLSALRAFRMVPNSRANFFLIEVVDPRLDSTTTFEKLLTHGVIVKDGSVSFKGLDKRYMRVDVSLKRHMDRLVDALIEIEREAA